MSLKNSDSNGQIRVTLVKSTNGRTLRQKACIKGLGLRKIGSTRILEKTAPITGMINKVAFLLSTEDI